MRLTLIGTLFGFALAAGAQEAAKPAITADEVIELSIKATGGRDAALKTKSIVAKGTMEIVQMGGSAAAETYLKAPDKRYNFINVDGYGEVQDGFDGKVAWSSEPQNGLVELKGDRLAAVKREAQFNGDLRWKELYAKGEVTGKEKVNGKDCWVVKLTPAEGKPVVRFYDVNTNLLSKVNAQTTTQDGEVDVAVEYSDYTDIGNGLKMPRTVKVTLPGIGDLITKYKDVTYNVEIDDAKFAMPKK